MEEGYALCVMFIELPRFKLRFGNNIWFRTSTPRGIVIGKVLDIKESEGSLFKEVIVQPECDFSLLDQVFIIRPPELVIVMTFSKLVLVILVFSIILK